jgi:hypothetical protein
MDPIIISKRKVKIKAPQKFGSTELFILKSK